MQPRGVQARARPQQRMTIREPGLHQPKVSTPKAAEGLLMTTQGSCDKASHPIQIQAGANASHVRLESLVTHSGTYLLRSFRK